MNREQSEPSASYSDHKLEKVGESRSPTGTLTPKDNQVASQSPSPVDHGNVDAPGAPLTPGEGGLSIDNSTRDGTPSHAATDLIVANAQPSVLDAPAKLGESVKEASPSRVSTRKAAVTGGTTTQKSEEKFQTKATTRRSGMTSRFKRLRRPRLSIRGVSLGDLENLMRKSPRRPSGSKEALSRKFVITVIVCAAITFVTLAVLVSLFNSTGKPPDTQRAMCKTEGCVSHAMLLTFHLNRSIDPCDDFSAYVCSAWKRDSQRYELGESVLVSSVYSWIKSYGAMLRTGAYKLPAGRKPLFMYDTCMADESAYGRSVEKFHEVMQEIGLSWPEDSPPESDAFGVLINLAFNWEEVSWFRATVSDGAVPGKERLVIVPARMLPVNFNQHRQVRVTGTYYDYWKSFYESFNLNGTPPIADKDTVRDLEQIESDVLENLLKALSTQAKEPMSFPLRNVTKYTSNISSDVWLAGINKYAPEGHEFTADDEVVVSGEAFMLTVGDLLSTYNDQQLLRYFSWQFVQLFGPVTDQRLFVTRYVLPERARIYRQVFCSYITDAPYEQLTSALMYASGFSGEDRKLVDAGFNNLITAAIKEIVSSHSLSEDSKKLIAQKLNSLALDLWPPDRYLINSALEWLYMNFTTHESTFGDYWASTRRSLLESKRISGFPYKGNGGRNFLPPYLSYDPITNSVSIAFSILSRPMYYKDGTKGMARRGRRLQRVYDACRRRFAFEEATRAFHSTSDGGTIQGFS
ncbi:hypothetical protein HPB50_007347 [Hyalomma asiaticum]|uniref:Uncharacterized protein n=1 Tax=Hyalomma asiaticum TaxID=266040 RepID=A0ACB7SU88_HYAAI|nr:hypothetical protein HPB50_007347 [Hyalomma asiaticum]